MSPLKKFGPAVLAIVVIVASFGGGLYVGTQHTYALSNNALSLGGGTPPANVDFNLFWKAWDILNQKFVETHGNATTTDQAKVYGAIQGLAASFGDPYTVFFPPVENKDFQTQISGNFEGVGMEVGIKNGVITVISPLKNTPASRAGIVSGDMILKINASSTQDMSVDEAVSLIRGKKGTTVTLSVLSTNAKQAHEVKIVRDKIDIPTIETETKDGVFVIHLYTFTENSAALFKDAIQKFTQSGTNKLVLDLRGNPGGYLDAAVDMASWFLPSDKVVVTEDTGGHGENTVYKSHGYNIFANKNLKMAILVDSGSASASEILSGALQQQGVAKLVGLTTFGKGSVQELVPLTSDTSLKVTVARWLTPNGSSISAHGLKPDIEVPITAEQVQAGQDPQMAKALEIVKQ